MTRFVYGLYYLKDRVGLTARRSPIQFVSLWRSFAISDRKGFTRTFFLLARRASEVFLAPRSRIGLTKQTYFNSSTTILLFV
jgi:hypothetical protein